MGASGDAGEPRLCPHVAREEAGEGAPNVFGGGKDALARAAAADAALVASACLIPALACHLRERETGGGSLGRAEGLHSCPDAALVVSAPCLAARSLPAAYVPQGMAPQVQARPLSSGWGAPPPPPPAAAARPGPPPPPSYYGGGGGGGGGGGTPGGGYRGPPPAAGGPPGVT